MQTEIKKWGNSAAVKLPASLLADLALEIGSSINLKQKNGALLVEAARPLRQGWFPGGFDASADEDVLASLPVDESGGEWVW